MLNQGMQQADVARYYQVTPGYISAVIKLRDLPECTIPLVHLETYKDYLDKVDYSGLNLLRDDMGRVLTMTIRNAQSVLKLLPPKYGSDYELRKSLLNKMFESDKVLAAASRMSQSKFETFLAEEAVNFGLIDEGEGVEDIASVLKLNNRWRSILNELLMSGDEEAWSTVKMLKKHNILT
jgi:hypothetical protein